MKPASKATGTKGLKPRYDVLLLNVAFNFNLRRYTKVKAAREEADPARQAAEDEAATAAFAAPATGRMARLSTLRAGGNKPPRSGGAG